MRLHGLAGAVALWMVACAPPEGEDALVQQAHELPDTPYPPPQAECDARWLPTACTEAVVAPQWVDYVSAASCTGSASAGAVQLAQFLAATFPGHGGYGIYDCRPIQGGTALSLHAEGRAIDFMIPMDPSQPYGANNAVGDPVATWLMEHAEEVGIQSFSWDRTIFYGDEAAPKHHCLSITNGHWDHLHIELSWAGANRQTPWFNQPVEPDETSPVAGFSWPALQPLGPRSGLALPTTAQRQFDTRSASNNLLRGNGTRSGMATGTNTITGWTGLASGATGAWLNLAVVPQTAAGHVAAWPAGQPAPGTSNLNFQCQTVRANGVPVPLGTSDQVSLSVSSDVHLIGDLYASFTPGGDGLVESDPNRILDTRTTTSLVAGETRAIGITCPAGAPDCTNAQITGVVASVAAIGHAAPGYLVAWPCGGTLPGTSHINFGANQVVANTVVAKLGGGQLCVYASAAADVIVDLTGVVTPTGSTRYQAFQPRRLVDTRLASGTPFTGRLGIDEVVSLPIQSLPNMPVHVRSVALEVTTVQTDGPSYITAYPCELGTPPGTSVLNTPGGGAVGALATSRVDASGKVCLRASGRTHLIVDLLGAWVEADSDGDGSYDFQESCDQDPAKTSPGACGCGIADTDTDTDTDGTADCLDACKLDPAKTVPGACGCGVSDADSDTDGWLDCQESCPLDPAKTAPGTCGCGVPEDDSDADGALDCQESCPLDPAKTAPGTCGCGVADVDVTGDGLADCPDCGDGLVEVGEGCDDGNLVDGDACSATCQVESLAIGVPATVRAGTVNAFEAGNVVPGQGAWLVRGSGTANAEVPGCPGLMPPVRFRSLLGSAVAGTDGLAHFEVTPPAGSTGAEVTLFAVDLEGCRVSRAVSVVLQ